MIPGCERIATYARNHGVFQLVFVGAMVDFAQPFSHVHLGRTGQISQDFLRGLPSAGERGHFDADEVKPLLSEQTAQSFGLASSARRKGKVGACTDSARWLTGLERVTVADNYKHDQGVSGAKRIA